MKNLLKIMMVMLMMFSLAACGSSDGTGSNEGNKESAKSQKIDKSYYGTYEISNLYGSDFDKDIKDDEQREQFVEIFRYGDAAGTWDIGENSVFHRKNEDTPVEFALSDGKWILMKDEDTEDLIDKFFGGGEITFENGVIIIRVLDKDGTERQVFEYSRYE